jgi:predicted permease
MGIDIVAGRDLTELDDARSESVVLVNEAFARRYWPGEDPLGSRVGTGRNQPEWYTVIGVVEDVNREALDEPATPELFLPALQAGATTVQVVARTGGDLDRTVAGMREAVRELDGTLPVEFNTLEAYVAASVNRSQFYTQLFGAFALLALALAGVGVYGTMSYTVTQRTREMGIRLALGAEAGQVTRMVARQGLRITAAGLLVGLFIAALSARVVEGFLFGVSVRDPVTYGAGSMVLALVAMAACWLPARRAGLADPIGALREE